MPQELEQKPTRGVVATFAQQRPRFDPATYLGVGKEQEMHRFVRNEPEADRTRDTSPVEITAGAKETEEPRADPDTRRTNIVLVDHEISSMQARKFENDGAFFLVRAEAEALKRLRKQLGCGLGREKQRQIVPWRDCWRSSWSSRRSSH